MSRYLCVHGHFYQPPRENPWLEAIELQDSAYPYHDWNERITAECYEPNGSARILDGDGRIEAIVNNYDRISFNFGPTLLSWLEMEARPTYDAILEADNRSLARFSGHGSALAQVYNHMILPLANRRDRSTQVRWGIRDFEYRFGRAPEGMWLAETAADVESLEILAEQGIRFTLLAPHQARRVRRIGGRGWRDVSGAHIDPRMPYLAKLPSGRTMALFFYDGPVSRGVAFERLLSDGRRFAERLTGLFNEGDAPQLAHIATDGETYGHHHRHGEMALGYALSHIEEEGLARLTVYGEFLERHPPTHEVEIHERTSWSCTHGVDRWWKDCGCNSGGRGGWNQGWRTPLRDALDGLRDELAPLWEARAAALLREPWAARDDYIDVVLDRSEESQGRFFARHAVRDLEGADRIGALKLLELQRNAMLMYTSCGWFFDELSGIETVQVIQYAARAIQLARDVLGHDPEPAFLGRLEKAKSNLPEHGDGARIYKKFVRPAMVDLEKVGAHYAISSLFEDYGAETRIYCYTVRREDVVTHDAGKSRLLLGKAAAASLITGESARLSFGVVHLGDHNLQAGVRIFRGDEAYAELVKDARAAFDGGDLPQTLRLLDRHFDGVTSSLRSLFRDEQRRIVGQILESTLVEVETSLRGIYDHHAPLMRFLSDLGTPPPRAFKIAAEFVLNTSLKRALAADPLDHDRVAALLASAGREGVALDGAVQGYALSGAMERLMQRLGAAPLDLALLHRAEAAADLAGRLPFEVNLWKAQNLYYQMLRRVYPEIRSRSDEEARSWAARFVSLGEKLSVRVA